MQINKCANCGAAMSCTCQTRRSIGGKMGCTACIGALNAADRKSGISPIPPKTPPPANINKAIPNPQKPVK
jgi:hypothetical protein